ncbi:band 4.1-like protein 4B [Ranitomeya imitator]|uniref:band 4.1-like protein 4B n=1 Tax=Ranitomeya imitator TaxID=111125 RepID=UPI0037E957C7
MHNLILFTCNFVSKSFKKESTPPPHTPKPIEALIARNVRFPSARSLHASMTRKSNTKALVHLDEIKKDFGIINPFVECCCHTLTAEFNTGFRQACMVVGAHSNNHSDEDDLPPALAAVAAESAAEQRAALLLASTGNSQASSIEKSPSRVSSSFTLEPGDLLMDFTEATPMIKTYPADPSNSFFDPCAIVQEYPVDLLDTPLQQYSVEPSPKRHSPAIHMVTPRQLMNQVQTMQTTQSLRTSKVDSSEGLRRELEREKMMKRLLMTEL